MGRRPGEPVHYQRDIHRSEYAVLNYRQNTRVRRATPAASELTHLEYQEGPLEEAAFWVVPNHSGLNTHQTTESLTRWCKKPAVDAGTVA